MQKHFLSEILREEDGEDSVVHHGAGFAKVKCKIKTVSMRQFFVYIPIVKNYLVVKVTIVKSVDLGTKI